MQPILRGAPLHLLWVKSVVRPMWRGGLRWSEWTIWPSLRETSRDQWRKGLYRDSVRRFTWQRHMCALLILSDVDCVSSRKPVTFPVTRKKILEILSTLASFSGIDIDYLKMFRCLANVILNGPHILEKDQQKDAVLLQTSVKKARMPG